MVWLLKVGLALAAGVGLDRAFQKAAQDPDVQKAMTEAREGMRRVVKVGAESVRDGAEKVAKWADKIKESGASAGSAGSNKGKGKKEKR